MVYHKMKTGQISERKKQIFEDHKIYLQNTFDKIICNEEEYIPDPFIAEINMAYDNYCNSSKKSLEKGRESVLCIICNRIVRYNTASIHLHTKMHDERLDLYRKFIQKNN